MGQNAFAIDRVGKKGQTQAVAAAGDRPMLYTPKLDLSLKGIRAYPTKSLLLLSQAALK
jgi:hypothetical protein